MFLLFLSALQRRGSKIFSQTLYKKKDTRRRTTFFNRAGTLLLPLLDSGVCTAWRGGDEQQSVQVCIHLILLTVEFWENESRESCLSSPLLDGLSFINHPFSFSFSHPRQTDTREEQGSSRLISQNYEDGGALIFSSSTSTLSHELSSPCLIFLRQITKARIHRRHKHLQCPRSEVRKELSLRSR